MNSKLRDIFAEYYHRWVKYGYYGNPEKLDQDTEFNQFETAIRQAVGEEMLEMLDDVSAVIEGDESWLVKSELRQKIKEWQRGEDE